MPLGNFYFEELEKIKLLFCFFLVCGVCETTHQFAAVSSQFRKETFQFPQYNFVEIF